MIIRVGAAHVIGDVRIGPNHSRIYVACLAAYNNGYLHGVWIDADREFQKARRSAR